MSEFMRSRYNMDDDGNFDSAEEMNKAFENGHVDELPGGKFIDNDTKTIYWSDGTVKE